MQSKNMKFRRRLPYITAIIGLAPSVLAELNSGAYVSGLLGLFLVACNLYAVRKVPDIGLPLEAAIMLADSFAAGINAVQNMQRGTQGLHIVWWMASAAFLIACAILVIRKRAASAQHVSDSPRHSKTIKS